MGLCKGGRVSAISSSSSSNSESDATSSLGFQLGSRDFSVGMSELLGGGEDRNLRATLPVGWEGEGNRDRGADGGLVLVEGVLIVGVGVLEA